MRLTDLRRILCSIAMMGSRSPGGSDSSEGTLEDFEEMIRWGDFPSTPRDVLSELVWYLGEVQEMSRVLSHLRYLAEEAQRLLDVQQTDQQPQPQRRRAPLNEWRL